MPRSESYIEITKREVGNVVIFDVAGEIDLYNATDLKDLIDNAIKEHKYDVLVNLAKVPFVDSSGIGTLVTGMYKLKKYHGNLKVMNIAGSVAKVFKLTGMETHLEVYATEEEALQSFKNR